MFKQLGSILAAIAITTAPVNAQSVPAGYFKITDGVFGRWCGRSCVSQSDIYTDVYHAMEVWCRDIRCGKTFIEVSFLRDGVVVDTVLRSQNIGKGGKAIFVFPTAVRNATNIQWEKFEAFP